MKKRKSIRYHAAYALTWLLVVCFLNTITDTAVVSFTSTGYDEMESVAEWVSEDLLGIENAFPEDKEDNDTEKKTQQSFNDWENYLDYNITIALSGSRLYLCRNDNDRLNRSLAIVTPPPDLLY